MPDGLGNSEMVRTVAEQLFEVWKAEQAREAKDTRRFFGSNVSGWVALVILVGSGVATGKGIHDLASDANARSIRNENAIVNMRVTNSDRLARIEVKLDRVLEEGKK